MNALTSHQVADMLGIQHKKVTILRQYCGTFPSSRKVGSFHYHNADDVIRFVKTHDVQALLKQSYRAQRGLIVEANEENEEYQEVIYKSTLDNGLAQGFLKLAHAPFHHHANRDEYAEFLISEEFDRKMKFRRRIGLIG